MTLNYVAEKNIFASFVADDPLYILIYFAPKNEWEKN